MVCLPNPKGARYVFVAIDGISPEFAFDGKAVGRIESKDCRISRDQPLSLVTCDGDKVAEFTVENLQGQTVTFAVIPKSMAMRAWRVNATEGNRLVFSDETILRCLKEFVPPASAIVRSRWTSTRRGGSATDQEWFAAGSKGAASFDVRL